MKPKEPENFMVTSTLNQTIDRCLKKARYPSPEHPVRDEELQRVREVAELAMYLAGSEFVRTIASVKYGPYAEDGSQYYSGRPVVPRSDEERVLLIFNFANLMVREVERRAREALDWKR